MACSCAGLVALLVVFAAAVLNVVAFILPMWTTSSAVNASLADELTSAEFAAGLWGFCTDVELKSSANESVAYDHCYFFHTSSSYNLSEIDGSFTSNFSDYSVCDGYEQARAAGQDVLLVYSSVLAYVAGMNGTTFGDFLDKSCGSLGAATLALGAISMGAGAFAFLFLTLGITCCKSKSFFVVVGRIMAFFGFLATLMTFIIWLPQSHVLGEADDVTLNGSFVLSVIAAALYLVGLGLVARHAAISK